MSGIHDLDALSLVSREVGLSIRFIRQWKCDADTFETRLIAEYPHRHYFRQQYTCLTKLGGA